jgi:L-ascorbate metabolism protein UlaG (beta-lactamase superfamily)
MNYTAMKKLIYQIALTGLFLILNKASYSQPNTLLDNTGNNIESVQPDSIEVTYIANSGFLISTSTKKVLIDALFSGGGGYYPAPSSELRTQMINGTSPFDTIDLLLATHSHDDHFTASLANGFLSYNSSSFLIGSDETTDLVNPGDRVISITPSLFSSIDTTINTIKIKVLRLRHDGGGSADNNLGYIIDFDGITVFHAGDNDGYVDAGESINGISEYDSLGFDSLNIDIALLNRGFFWDNSSPGIEIVKNYIKPRHIILHHFSLNNIQGERNYVNIVVANNSSELPGVTILENSMESIRFTKSADSLIVLDPPILIRNTTGNNKLKIYPNPARDMINISFGSMQYKTALVKITDISGKLISMDTYHNLPVLTVNLSGNPKGVYLVSINIDGVSISKKIFLE